MYRDEKIGAGLFRELDATSELHVIVAITQQHRTIPAGAIEQCRQLSGHQEDHSLLDDSFDAAGTRVLAPMTRIDCDHHVAQMSCRGSHDSLDRRQQCLHRMEIHHQPIPMRPHGF